MTDYIIYENTKYPVRELRLSEYEVDVRVSTESLYAQIFDTDGNYTSREAQLIDEIIFFYAPDSIVTDADDHTLEQYIIDNLEW